MIGAVRLRFYSSRIVMPKLDTLVQGFRAPLTPGPSPKKGEGGLCTRWLIPFGGVGKPDLMRHSSARGACADMAPRGGRFRGRVPAGWTCQVLGLGLRARRTCSDGYVSPVDLSRLMR